MEKGRKKKAATSPRRQSNSTLDMPPYPMALLSDKELTDIFASLQALPGRRPVKDIPMLND